MNPLAYARAIIAAVLTTGLVVVVVMREITTGEAIDEAVDGPTTSEATGDVFFGQLDATFLMLAIAIIILVVPDTIAYFKHKKAPEKEDD